MCTGQWSDDRRSIDSFVTVDVVDRYKGSPGETLTFTVPGGQVGRYMNLVPGAPSFTRGDRAVLFLTSRGPRLPITTGFTQGIYRVTMDARGAAAGAAAGDRHGGSAHCSRRCQAKARAAGGVRGRRARGAGTKTTMKRVAFVFVVASSRSCLASQAARAGVSEAWGGDRRTGDRRVVAAAGSLFRVGSRWQRRLGRRSARRDCPCHRDVAERALGHGALRIPRVHLGCARRRGRADHAGLSRSPRSRSRARRPPAS